VRRLNVRPPSTVVAYAFLVMALILVALVREGSQGRWLGGAFLLLLVTFGLLQGVWAAWAFLVFVAVGDIVVGVVRFPDWRAASIAAVNGLMLILLLARSTRQYAGRGRPRLLGRIGFGELR
jgi:hypothetical protein